MSEEGCKWEKPAPLQRLQPTLGQSPQTIKAAMGGEALRPPATGLEEPWLAEG